MVHYVEWTKRHMRDNPSDEIILLGTQYDPAATALRSALLAEALPFSDGIGKYHLAQIGGILADCVGVVGSDTGLLHLAEAVGTPVVTIFGPTRADFGFGPLDERSKPVEATLWCSPCSKDGTLCFRPVDRFACLSRISAPQVESALRSLAPAAESPKKGNP